MFNGYVKVYQRVILDETGGGVCHAQVLTWCYEPSAKAFLGLGIPLLGITFWWTANGWYMDISGMIWGIWVYNIAPAFGWALSAISWDTPAILEPHTPDKGGV